MNKEMKYIRVLIMMMALMWGAVSGAWAQLTASDIEYEVKPIASAGTVSPSVSERTVTLTVTPATGYFIKASDFVVEKLVNTGKANAPKRRVSDITNLITGKLYNSEMTAEISSVSAGGTAKYVFTLPADYDGAYVTATFHLLTENEIIRITRSTSLGESPSMSAHYVLVEDVSATVVDVFYSKGTFTGTFEGEPKADGSFPTISGLTHALFQTVEGGTVKNIVLDNVTISGSTTVTVGGQSKTATGAIANVATGASRIYNCGIQATGSSVTTDKDGYTLFSTVLDPEKKPQHKESSSTVGGVDYVGGLVGFLDGTARVINCYSYADITSGSFEGGIVGRNNVATTASNLQTMVMNCMFYGNLTSGNKAPIYNGVIITNRSDQSGVSNFNYFWAGAPYVQIRNNINTYNCALTAETRYLQRFEFFRHLLNGHRELAAWWVQGDDFEKDEMAKWVMEPSQIGTTTPYPILKSQGKYPSVVNYKPSDETIDANNEHYNEGRKLGTLSVTIRMGSNSPYDAPSGARLKSGQSMTLTLPITDKDPAHFNFNYGKVQLPYYNDYGIGNYTGNRVVTGWKIVSISGGTAGSYSTDNDNNEATPADATASVNDNGDITLTTPYNFADRKCTDKDKFEVSGRVFSQGAYFDVPEGVSSIIIEPYWAKAVFVADDYRDVVCDKDMNNKYGIGTVGGGQWFNVGEGTSVSHDFAFNGEGTLTLTVHNTLANAVTTLFNSETTTGRKPYDYAVVLVGNVHSLDISDKTSSKPYTIMSIDLDRDNEPDYSYILRFNSRVRSHPVRVDFLNIPGLGMAQKSTGGTGTYNLGIMQPLGWFESTNTSLFRFTQFEYDKKDRVNSPMILQGGVIEQWVTVGGSEVANKEGKTVTYYHVGSNVWFKEFHIGVHQDKTQDEFVSPHPPISVTGGDFDEFYLTGLYNTPNANYDDNAECYINGGRFGKVCGTGMQGIGSLTNHTNGNIIWQIDNADIDEFYAGGINAAHIAEGNITTVISNSRVDQFCGGPKFGNMNSTKKVVTNATNCTFRAFFGAGYGGNSYNRRYPSNINNLTDDPDWDGWVQGDDGLKYRYDSDYSGVETRIDYQYIPMSNNTQSVARLFVDHVSFSLATTHYVTSKLTGCTITTSKLGRLNLFEQCLGNFYGGGSLGKVTHDVKSTLTNCTVEGNVFGAGYSASLPPVDVMNNSFQTPPHYDKNLGAYLEAELPTTVSYTWEHAATVNSTETAINTTDHILYTTEDLTSLGKVEGNVILNIDGNTTLTNGKRMSVSHSVYGGGEESNVGGNTQVNITGGTITENVFGGGKGEADEFSCSKAMIGVNNAGAGANLTTDENKNKGTTVTISNGQVNGNVYGGGEVGRVEWNTQVKIGVGTGNGPFAPVINGSVFGAGKGKDTHGYAALVRGNSTVTVQGNAKVLQNVYGGGEQATVGRYWVKGVNDNVTGAPTAPTDTPDEMPYQTMSGGKCTVVVQGSAQVGPDSNVPITAGHVFGAGKGVTPNYVHTGDKANWSKRMVDYNSTKHTGEPGTTWDYYPDNHAYVWEYFTTEDKYLEFLQTLALVTGTDVTIGGGTVKGSVFGGSESGYVQDNTNVKVTGGTIGTENLGGAYYGNVYGGGKGDAEHTGANHNYVAAGLVKGNTKVEIENGRIWHNVYGGGAYGSVGEFTYDATTGLPTGRLQSTTGGKAEVIITGGTIGKNGSENGMIFGSSRGDVGAPGAIHDKLAWVYNTEVKIGTSGSGSVFTTPTIKGSVYGGGENGHVFNDAAVYIYSGTVGIPSGETIGDYSGAAYPYRGNVYGSGCGTDKYYSGAIPEGHTATDGKGNKYNPLAGIVQGNTSVNISGGHVVRNVYGAGAMGSVGTASDANSGKTTITVTGGRIGYDGNSNNDGNIFGAARGDLAATGDNLAQVRETEVNISYATTPTADNEDKNVQLIAGSVFGGGEAGIVKGSVAVSMTRGLILKDVYGGGALADTQTSNWDASANSNAGGWADTNQKSALNTTTVRLTGGTILGEAYGGALGQKNGVNGATSDIAAYVYGDVLLDLNGTTSSGETGAAIDNTAKGCVVGQVFGCNNINGSPKGDVMVHVYATQNKDKGTIAQKYVLDNESLDKLSNTETDDAYVTRLKRILSDRITIAEALSISDLDDYKALISNNDATAAELKTAITNVTSGIDTKNTEADKRIINSVRYDMEAVYGGGNMAAYVPVTPYKPTDAPTGAKTQVIIEGCSKTSIETVYGGGNAAAVPETNVEIREAYEILAVFGGGNGKDKILINNVLTDNPGADIGQYKNGTETVIYGTGDANSTLKGGYIHEAYGGSNTKGVVKGNLNQTSNPGTTCTLIVDKIVGAGKYADIDGDVIMTLSCQPSSKVPLLFAGADEANVNGNITLNITNGHFGKVFGGNNLGGAVKGKITVNVEETGCQPIKIDELYLGGNEAAYSIYGYYESEDIQTETGKKILKPRESATDARKPVKYDGTEYESISDFTNYAQPELNITSCTYIGKVFGGGLGAPAKMYANPTVNVNMVAGDFANNTTKGVPAVMTELGIDVTKTAPNPDKLGIIGDVFGGGNEADIVGNTTVNIAVEYVVKQVNVGASVTDYYTRSGAGTTADPFVYTAATGTAVEGKTYYEKKANQGSAYIIGSIFGGGNAADVLGNTNVTMSDGYVFNGIFGGGYAGNVGTFTRRTDAQYTSVFGHTAHDGCIGKPISCAEGTGKCTVLVNGGQIGPISVALETEGMNRKDEDGKGIPVPEGWVWGAGQGLVEDPATHPDTHFTSYVGSTDVTIGGTALIMESIIGGGEFGRVLGNTLVKIEGGQIGVGAGMVQDGKPVRYDDANFIDPSTATAEQINAKAALMPECSHFPYGNSSNEYLPYDPYYGLSKYSTYVSSHTDFGPASTTSPSDGKTWIGCVFGGGSGYMPYEKENGTGYDWCPSAGLVEGDAEVRISGGHILTNVYGGNEVTDVKGKSIVKMTGGTIGVPRTVQQIIDHPLTCYLFGAGKGDERSHFYDYTNVGSVEVDISGGIIYGSVFGGSEDGHVNGDISLTIRKGGSFTIGSTEYTNGPIIGTWGTSYVDGNVFGAGRGFSGNTLTAGNVGGNVTLNITGGNILGSVYGGGRLASVGTYLVPSTDANYGKMIADNDNATHGHVTINISGGTIGNRYEYAYYAPNTTIDKTANHIPYTEFDATTNRLTHTKGGNVFAGAMGRLYALNGTTVLPRWLDLGKVKSTKLTVSGSAVIKSSIYGGGELGWTTGTHKTSDNKDVSTEISIKGGTIGSEITDNNVVQYTYGSVFGGGYGSDIAVLTVDDSNKTYPIYQAGRVMNSTAVNMSGGTVKASVYGGGELANVGYGFYSFSNGDNGIGETALAQPSDAANTYVTVSGGTIGRTPTIATAGNTYYGGASMGNVYGGGSGDNDVSRCGLVFGNTNVNISGEATRIYHNVYGGGAYGSVGDYEYATETVQQVTRVKDPNAVHTTGTGTAEVIITGGIIGYDGKDNGMVFGSSRGDVQGEDSRDNYMAWVNDAYVTIGTSSSTTGPHIRGSVYGSGENGHVFHNTDIKIYSGTIGIDNADTSVEGYTVTSGGTSYNGPEYPSRGNVYGGGCGTDTYTKNDKVYFNPTAGIVKGNTTVTMTGGHVVRSVYGGGSMGSVGTFTNDENGKPISCVEAAGAVPATDTTPAVPAVEGTGLCTVTIKGGKIGPTTMAMPNYYGNVFGAGRGEVHDPAVYPNLETSAYFNRTAVTINGTAFVKGSVYGGAESGHVLNDTHVVIDENSQIGCGKNATNRYEDDVWASSYVPNDAVDLECVSWPFAAPYAPYDKFAKTTGYYDDNKTQSADNALPTGSDGHTFYGNVFGGGSGSTPYAAGKWLPTAGWVEGNTTVEINGGHILTSVYGGNEMSDVGAGGVKKMTDLTNETADMFYDITKPGGKCTVKMTGGTIGVPRTVQQIIDHPLTCYLFGAGKGDQRIFFNKTTNVKEVEVEVSGGKIYGSVFGGGEDGHVMRDVKMTIKDNANIGTWGTSYVDGNVFGGGRGFSGEALTAGNVGGSVQIDIKGGSILGSVYGGGRLGSVGYGLYLVDETVGDKKPYGVMRDDNVDDRGNEVAGFKRGYITINISGGTIGNDNEYIYNPTAAQKAAIRNTTFDSENHLQYTKGGNVFTGGMGRLFALDNSTLLTLWPKLGKCKQTTLNMTGGTVKSSVYGGGEIGAVAENATVNVNGGTVGTKVVDSEDAAKYYYFGSVFGGGKGSTADIEGISAAGTTQGDVEVNLNQTVASNDAAKGAIVSQVFGCNDMNGSPKGNVTVHVYATQNADKDNISTKYDKNTGTFDVEAVYGGGNLAAYEPTSSTGSTNVIIDGCRLTSIRQVYGGGNAASTPATNVTVNGTYEILELFGGGNGFDKLPDGRPNPGANVGYKNYTVYTKVGDNWVASDDPNYDTKEERTASNSAIVYGSGRASLNVYGGTIHRVFGGSNTKGNVRQTAVTLLEESGGCTFCVDEAYGGGKSAEMDAEAKLLMACIPGLQAAYGGAEEADVHGNVTLNITNGTFDRVFGGNNLSGTISGAITVNIEEVGCRPIIIGELYGGGNQAGYSVYGYDSDGKPIETVEPGTDPLYEDPQVNVKSFTSIGKIFGGGYGSGATMVGNPTVNVNEVYGRYYNQDVSVVGEGAKTREDGYSIPSHAKDKMGAISEVFGGGNAAKVIGNTTVNIATAAEVYIVKEVTANTTLPAGCYTRSGDGTTASPFVYTEATGTASATVTYYEKKDVLGADIRGNVYGGGNNAKVTGNTNVNIGKKEGN